MKRKQTQPDFRKLCQPGQHHTADYISLLIFFYFVTSIGGYWWEVLIFLWKDGSFYNRGFFYGPWLPIYGVGAITFYLFFHKIKHQPLKIFLLSTLLGSVLELLIGWVLSIFFGLRYWDYSGYPWNLFGYVCLYSAIGFGIAGVLWICLFSGLLEKLWFRLPSTFRYFFQTFLLLLLLLDISAALIFPNKGEGITFPK